MPRRAGNGAGRRVGGRRKLEAGEAFGAVDGDAHAQRIRVYHCGTHGEPPDRSARPRLARGRPRRQRHEPGRRAGAAPVSHRGARPHVRGGRRRRPRRDAALVARPAGPRTPLRPPSPPLPHPPRGPRRGLRPRARGRRDELRRDDRRGPSLGRGRRSLPSRERALRELRIRRTPRDRNERVFRGRQSRDRARAGRDLAPRRVRRRRAHRLDGPAGLPHGGPPRARAAALARPSTRSVCARAPIETPSRRDGELSRFSPS